MDLGWPEVLLIMAIVLIVFGAGKLPQVASQLGKGIREFRKASSGKDDDNDTKQVAAAESGTKMIVDATATEKTVGPTATASSRD